jgi:uncharacterized protein YoxC
MNEPDKKVKKKGKGFAIAAILFSAAIWFALLGVYLYRAMLSYKPLSNAVQEGYIVSFFLMLLLFAVAALCCAVSLVNLVIYLFKRSSKEN